MTLRVLSPGFNTVIVDFGRPRSRSLGVPVGGAADRFAMALGNGLVGNPPETAAMEITLAGPTLQADCELACVLYGSPFDLTCDGQKLKVGTTFSLPAGEELRIGGTRIGLRAYLCVRGGFQTPLILGSHSGLEPLRTGVELPCSPGTIPARFLYEPYPRRTGPVELRILDGAQASWFPLDAVLQQQYYVAPASDRMGLRLQGSPLPVPPREMESEPVCPGSVQVTSDGQCIVLGVDGQTIGGYPKIAHVISADLDVLGQLRPNERIRFVRVTPEEAEWLHGRRRAELSQWLTRLQVGEWFS
jgi:antagonist of KipI